MRAGMSGKCRGMYGESVYEASEMRRCCNGMGERRNGDGAEDKVPKSDP
jgi:hypothetical protein